MDSPKVRSAMMSNLLANRRSSGIACCGLGSLEHLRRKVVHLDQVDDLPGFPPLLENFDKLDNILVQKHSLFPQSFRRESRQEHLPHPVMGLVAGEDQAVLRGWGERIERLVLVGGGFIAIDVLPGLLVDEADFRGSQAYDWSVAFVHCFDAPRLAAREV